MKKFLALALLVVCFSAIPSSSICKDRIIEVKDKDGNWQTLNFIADNLRVSAMQLMYDIAEGNVTGSSTLHVEARNPDVDTSTSPETIWVAGGLRNYLDVDELVQVVSSSAEDAGTLLTSGTSTGGSTTSIIDTGATFISDGVLAGDIVINDTNDMHAIIETVDSETQLTTKPTGMTLAVKAYRIATVATGKTGAAVVHITGLDEDWDEADTHIIMNGTTDVESDTSLIRINKFWVTLAGSNGSNVGAISVENNASATVLSQIGAGINASEDGSFTVPNDKTLYITGLYAGEGNNDRCIVYLYKRHDGEVFRPAGGAVSVKQSHGVLSFDGPIKLKAKTDVELRGVADTDDAKVSGGFEGYYK